MDDVEDRTNGVVKVLEDVSPTEYFYLRMLRMLIQCPLKLFYQRLQVQEDGIINYRLIMTIRQVDFTKDSISSCLFVIIAILQFHECGVT